MAPAPLVTRATASASGGFAWSRFGPTLPVEPASCRVWQPEQPALRKTFFPAVGSPFLYCAATDAFVSVGTVPTTVDGSGFAVFSPGFEVEQPAAARASTIASGARRRTSASVYRPCAVHGRLSPRRRDPRHPYNPRHETQVIRPRRRPHRPDGAHD